MTLILTLLLQSFCHAAPESLQPIDFFSELRRENTQNLFEINQALDKEQVAPESIAKVEFLKNRKLELQSRQAFLNRMILKFDSGFKGGDVHQFLKVALREMSQVDVKTGSSENSIWKFLNSLAMSLDALPQGQLNVLKFVEGYMKRSSFKEPIEPKDYLSSLDYYNGVHAQRANGMSAVEAAEHL